MRLTTILLLTFAVALFFAPPRARAVTFPDYFTTPCGASCLFAGQSLTPGQSISSPSGNYTLLFRTDGNLVETDNSTGTVIWSSNTTGDGGVAVYGPGTIAGPLIASAYMTNSSGTVIWSTTEYITSNSYTHAELQIADSGAINVNLATPIWQSGTSYPSNGTGSTVFIPVAQKFYPGTTYTINSCKLAFQSGDGNMVIYAGGSPVWKTNTANEGASFAVLQTDLNFVVYNSSMSPLWYTNTARSAPGVGQQSFLAFQPDCNFVEYQIQNWVSF